MTVKYLKIKKLHERATIPRRAYSGDAGLDLTAVNCDTAFMRAETPSGVWDDVPFMVAVDFGFAVEIPRGYVGKLHARSSIYKTCCRLSNGVGVIDSGYRGSLMAKFDVLPHLYGNMPMPDWSKPCAQLVIEPILTPEIEEVEELSDTERGSGGYGSSN